MDTSLSLPMKFHDVYEANTMTDSVIMCKHDLAADRLDGKGITSRILKNLQSLCSSGTLISKPQFCFQLWNQTAFVRKLLDNDTMRLSRDRVRKRGCETLDVGHGYQIAKMKEQHIISYFCFLMELTGFCVLPTNASEWQCGQEA